MGEPEDRERAARARARGDAERDDREKHERDRDRAARQEHDEAEWRLWASCEPLWWFGGDDFAFGAGVSCVLALATAGVMWFDGGPLGALPTLAMALAVVPVALVAYAVYALALARMKAAWAKEQAWLDRQPYPIDGVLRGLGSSSASGRLVVLVSFEVRGEMPSTRASGLLGHVDPGGTATRRGEQLELCARVAGEPESPVARVRARRILFHDLVDGVLTPLHAEAPIARIALGD